MKYLATVLFTVTMSSCLRSVPATCPEAPKPVPEVICKDYTDGLNAQTAESLELCKKELEATNASKVAKKKKVNPQKKAYYVWPPQWRPFLF